MSDADESFNSLLAKARDGDPDAVAQIVTLYEPEVRRVARVLLGPALRPLLDSVDLAQSIHRSVLFHLRQGKFEVSTADHLMALTLTMVRRHVARHWRRMRRQVRSPQSLDEDIAAAGPLWDESSPPRRASTGGDADDPASQVEHAEQIEHVLGRLPDIDRQLIELRLLGHSTAEAARLVNLDPDVARVRLSRLRARLRLENGDPNWV
jgi:RNA polymerase sigma-70 factor (ECF subfamily)